MFDGAYTKEALVARTGLNPKGWYASSFERFHNKLMELRPDEIARRESAYGDWWQAKHGERPLWTDLLTTEDKVSEVPTLGQFRFREVAPKQYKLLLAKFKKYRMQETIIDTKRIKGELYVTGYANPIQ